MKILKGSLATVWLLSALASVSWPQEASLALLSHTGLTGQAALIALYVGIAVDYAMGMLILLPSGRWQRWLWPLQAAIILVYSVIILVFLPNLALHPFGILIKNIPILAILWLLWKESMKPNGGCNV